VTFEVIDADQRAAGAECQGLPIHDPDEQRPYQAGSRSDRHAVQLREADPRIDQGSLNYRPYRLHMRPAGQLRDHPAEYPMYVLGENRQRGQLTAAFLHPNYRGGGFVAGCLNPKDPLSHS
jgi:hypothetical protein